MGGWAYDRAGHFVYTNKSGIPGPPLATALRDATFSSLVGVFVGAVIVLMAVGFGSALVKVLEERPDEQAQDAADP